MAACLLDQRRDQRRIALLGREIRRRQQVRRDPARFPIVRLKRQAMAGGQEELELLSLRQTLTLANRLHFPSHHLSSADKRRRTAHGCAAEAISQASPPLRSICNRRGNGGQHDGIWPSGR
jgi:hypothetical protein